jgi:hypothetical protein
LRNANRDNAVSQRWPQKAAALQPLREQTRALAVMPNDLDQVAAAAPKNLEITSVRIPLQALLNQTRKARESAAHIGMASCKPHPHIARYGNHRRSSTRGPAPALPGQIVHPPGCVAGCQDRSRSIHSGRPVTAASVGHLRTEASNFLRPFLPPRQSAQAQNMARPARPSVPVGAR